MAKPVVTQPATPRTIAQGVAIPPLALVATNDPDTWVVTPLPAGLSLDEETGIVTGTPTSAGLVSSEITAENADGVSDPKTLVWNVQASPPGRGGPLDHELDFDMKSRLVTQPGIATPESGEVFAVKKGDYRPFLVGLIKDGVLQDLGATISLRLGLKELASERVIDVSTSTVEREGTGDQARYRIWVRMTPAKWRGILGDYEADEETRLIARGELQLLVGDVVDLYDETVSVSGLDLFGGLGVGGSGGEDPLDETLRFTGLTATAGASYTLTISLVVAGRSSQNVTLTRTLTLTFTAGAWVVSDLAGTAAGSGASEGTQWRVTVTNTAVAGDATGVDVDVRITTTLEAASYVFRFPAGVDLTSTGSINIGSPNWTLDLYDAEDVQIGTSLDLAGEYASGAAFLAALEAAWEAATGEGATVAIWSGGDSYVTVSAPSSTAVAYVNTDFTEPSTVTPTGGPGEGTHRTATLSGQLVQEEVEADLPTSISSRNFGVGIGDDIVPDA